LGAVFVFVSGNTVEEQGELVASRLVVFSDAGRRFYATLR
jgi:hypothetical protein